MSVQNQIKGQRGTAFGQAKSKINNAWRYGALLLVVGGLVFGFSTVASADEGAGVMLLVAVPALVAGQVLLLVATIATGVRLGVESAQRSL